MEVCVKSSVSRGQMWKTVYMESSLCDKSGAKGSVWRTVCSGQCVENSMPRAVHVKDSVTKAKHSVMLCNLKACVFSRYYRSQSIYNHLFDNFC